MHAPELRQRAARSNGAHSTRATEHSVPSPRLRHQQRERQGGFPHQGTAGAAPSVRFGTRAGHTGEPYAAQAYGRTMETHPDPMQVRVLHPTLDAVNNEAGITASAGSKGDHYDNVMAESIIGLCKAEVIHRLGPWRGAADVEAAILEWALWFNHHRQLEPLGLTPPSEHEHAHDQRQGEAAS